MDAKLFEVTLSNVAEGALETQFQERLQELGALIAEGLQNFESDKDGIVVAGIPMEARFSISPQGGIMVSVRAELKPPKRKVVTRSIHHRKAKNEWFVWDEPKQEPLKFPRAVEGEE